MKTIGINILIILLAFSLPSASLINEDIVFEE